MAITKVGIKPTKHYFLYHADVSWDLVIKTILSPTKSRLNKRKGKDRFTYIRYFKDFVIELHVKKDVIEDTIWVINAFKMRR
ncbi:hypothetical protein HYX16_05870 [Candidatus Woesearchaeota archaeon]|nr:hypothetical protein [Candidatus Woesearchaeota archaeon]